MALVVKDRVKETTSTTGTGTLTLAGAVTKFQSFSVVGDGNTTYYAIESGNGTDWEVGVGTYTASGTTLSRDTILESSNAGSAISLTGTSTVFCTYPAERSVNTASPHTFTADQTMGGFDVLGVSNIVHDISVTTVALDFSADELDTITVSATATFTCATYIAGASKTIKILDSGSGQTLAFPAGWIFVGTKPTAIAASKTGILTLTCFSTTEASVVAAYAEQT